MILKCPYFSFMFCPTKFKYLVFGAHREQHQCDDAVDCRVKEFQSKPNDTECDMAQIIIIILWPTNIDKVKI